MSSFNIIVGVVAAIIFIAVYILAFRLFVEAESICDLVLTPINVISDQIMQLCARFAVIPLLLFAPVLFFSVRYILQSISSGDILQTVMMGVLEGTTLMQFVSLGDTGFALKEVLTYPALAAMGISSFLSFLYMRCTVTTLKATGLPAPVTFLGVVLLNALFLCLSSLFNERIQQWSYAFSAYAVNLFHEVPQLFRYIYNLGDFMQFLGTAVLSLLIIGVGVTLAAISLREFFATILYGVFALVLAFALGFIVYKFPGCPQWIQMIFVFLIMFIPDYIRANEDLKESFVSLLTRKSR